MIVAAVERQAGQRVGVSRGAGEVTRGQGDVRAHQMAVAELERAERLPAAVEVAAYRIATEAL